MVRVGIVDLDTSHCELFTPLVNEADGLTVAAVWDGGSVRPAGYAATFAAEFGIDKVCGSLDELVESVDVGMLMGQNWDLHVERARPFLEAGKRVFIDKPLVGRMADVNALIALSERTGVPVMGGSSLRYAPPLTALREGGRTPANVVSAFASGPHDFFNYGVHAVAMIAGFFGPGIRAVTHIASGATDLFLLEWGEAGLPIVLQLSAPDVWEYSFFLALTTDRIGVEPLKFVCDDAFSDDLNRGLIAEFVRFAHGEPPAVAVPDLLEEVTVCLAAAEARRTGGRVALSDIPASAGFDGAAFTSSYARAGGWQDGAGGGSQQPSSSYSVGPGRP